jgi:hypothetical protein
MVLVLAQASFSLLAAPEMDATITCVGSTIKVSAHNEIDRRLLCEAAHEAIQFFLSHGMSRREPLLITVHQKAEARDGSIEIGRYKSRSGEVKMLSFDAYRLEFSGKRPFRSPVSQALYTSFGVHEIAHAIADENFQMSPVPWVAQEYIAAVAQFSTMDPVLRNRILGRYRLTAFDTPESMSSIYYQLDPGAFAIKAYLHYLALEDQQSFLQDLLSGAIVLGSYDDW